jgi:hypothetical protein
MTPIDAFNGEKLPKARNLPRTLWFEMKILNLCRARQELSIDIVFTASASNQMAVLLARGSLNLPSNQNSVK